ncbi:divalent metal cation transporter [Pelagicoccus enzymogenes]|uniref:divalent metal cation transporter n=1 Tax=Pelagicoccus enzymogenes TaxID=2773457 RepID=UPI00280EE2AB|nr:divalent metal cation transporter [Pelagicoccus enzymogenes]MDQ8196662.1 divalent metal cation transporter [Pelagicoccus enzymogenes]
MSLDPDNTAQRITEAQAQGTAATLKTYVSLSGPGWLQSAITLGGGSLAGALFLGVVGGYSMLWVQMCALFMGVIMLAAISYVSLSIKESVFHGMRTQINPVLAWGWILATLAANMTWALPQFSLAYGAITENIAPGLIGNADATSTKLITSIAILIPVVGITFLYGGKGIGIRIYETILKVIVGVIVFSFIGVAIKLALTDSGLPFGEILVGFIPNPSLIFEPSAGYREFLDSINNPAAQQFWTDTVLSKQRDVIVAAASAAVGINMTFLLPFSMRAKGWGKTHRGLAIFDLSTGMVVPFLIATACIVIASGYLFHAQPYDGVLVEENGQLAITQDASLSAQAGQIQGMLAARSTGELAAAPVENGELQVAAMLLNRSNMQFATSLEPLVGPTMAHIVFGFGVFAMALSTISILMLISGFVICEMFKFPHGGIHHKLGTLAGAVGILWPFLWSGSSKAYLAVPTSVFGYTLLPVAFLAFFLMMNSKKLLGDARPTGRARVIWNVLMGTSLLITGAASVATAWSKTIGDFAIGKTFLITFGIAIVIGHFYLKSKNAKLER